MHSWHVVQEICKMKSKNKIVCVEDEIVTVLINPSSGAHAAFLD